FRGAGVGDSPPPAPSASYTFWKAGVISRRDGSPKSSASVHPKRRSVSRFSAATLPRRSTTTMASGAASSICRNRLSCTAPSAPRASTPRNSLMTLPSCAGDQIQAGVEPASVSFPDNPLRQLTAALRVVESKVTVFPPTDTLHTPLILFATGAGSDGGFAASQVAFTRRRTRNSALVDGVVLASLP